METLHYTKTLHEIYNNINPYEYNKRKSNRALMKWAGNTGNEFKDHKFGKPVDRLPEVELPEDIRSSRKGIEWSNDPIKAIEYDHERFLENRNCFMLRNTISGQKRGVKKLYITTVALSNISANNINDNAKKLTAMIDHYEAQGIRCELVWFFHSQNTTHDNKNVLIQIPIKNSSEPLDLSLIYWILSPVFFRFWITSWMDSNIPACTKGKGTTIAITETVKELDITENEIIKL